MRIHNQEAMLESEFGLNYHKGKSTPLGLYDSLHAGPHYKAKTPDMQNIIKMYDDVVEQEKFFTPHRPGSLQNTRHNPHNPPLGFYYVYASVWRDAYKRLE